MDNNPAPQDNQQPVVPETPATPVVQPDAPAVPQAVPAAPGLTVQSAAEPAAPAAAPAPQGLDAIFDQIAEKIIEQQEAIIGPVAVDQARSVSELKIDWPQHQVDIEGSPQVAIDELVEQYKELFGQIAVETCKEAVANLLSQVPADQQPSSLKA